MSDHYLREKLFSSAGHVIDDSDHACLAAIHLTIGVLDIDQVLLALLETPRLTRRWIATRTKDLRTIELTVYVYARHATQAWASAHAMRRLLRREAVPVHQLWVTDAQDWTRHFIEEMDTVAA